MKRLKMSSGAEFRWEIPDGNERNANSYGYYMRDLCPSCAVCQSVLSHIFKGFGGISRESEIERRANEMQYRV